MNTLNTRQLISNIRSRHYLTLEALALRLNVSMMTVFNWEKGKSKPLDVNMLKLRKEFPDEFSRAETDSAVV